MKQIHAYNVLRIVIVGFLKKGIVDDLYQRLHRSLARCRLHPTTVTGISLIGRLVLPSSTQNSAKVVPFGKVSQSYVTPGQERYRVSSRDRGPPLRLLEYKSVPAFLCLDSGICQNSKVTHALGFREPCVFIDNRRHCLIT